MRINKLRLQNINSLKAEVLIDFQAAPLLYSGLFAITGDTGAGKTTILDAITLALYGKVARNKEVKEVISYGAIDCLAEVEFEHNQRLFRAKWSLWRARGKTDGNLLGPKRELAEWDAEKASFEIIAEKIKEVDQGVEALTGLDYDRFRRSVLLAQGDFAAFLEANEKDRGELLERITGTKIYTQLSQAAFQKFREEEQKLKDLDLSIKGFSLLLPEELEDLEKEAKALQNQSKAQEKELELLSGQIQSFSQLQQFKTNKDAFYAQLQQLEASEEAFAEAFNSLMRFDQVKPFQKSYDELNRLAKELEQLQQDHRLQAQHIQGLEEEKVSKETSFQKSNTALNTHKRELQILKPQWEEAIALDIKIDTKQKPFEDLKNNLSGKRKEQEDLELRLNKSKLILEDTQAILIKANAYLENAPYLSSLPVQLNYIEEKIRQFGSLQLQQQKSLSTKEQLEKDLKLRQQEGAQLQEKNKKLKKTLADKQEEFERLSPESFSSDRGQLLELIDQQIAKRNEAVIKLEQAIKTQKNYENLLDRYNQENDQLNFLIQQEQQLNRRILNALDVLAELESVRTYKRNILEQQQLIANYEKDRAELKDGDPCPLCFSEHHPFREMEVKPFVDQAQREFDVAKREHERARRVYTSILAEQAKTSEASAQKMVLKSDYEQQIEQLESELSQLFPKASFLDSNFGKHSNVFSQQLKQYTTETQAQQIKRDQLAQVHQSLNQLEKQLNHSAQEVLKKDNEILWLSKQLEQNVSQIQEQELATQQLGKELEGFADEYQLKFSKDKISNFLRELKQLAADYQKQLQDQQNAQQQIKTIEQELKHWSAQLNKLKTDILQEEEGVAKMQEEIINWQKKRKRILGTRNPKEEEKEYAQQQEQLETALEQLRQKLKTLEVGIHSRQEIAASLLKNIDVKKEQADQLRNSLLDQLKENSIADLDAFAALILAPEKEAYLRKEKQQLTLEKTRLEGLIKEQDKTIAQLQEKLAALPNEEMLFKQQQDLQLQFQKVLQTLGAIAEKLKSDQERRAEQQSLLQKRVDQHQEFLRWAALNEIIGSADGKKFRTFAQGLTLERLTNLANMHLTKLNGRYQLSKPAEQDLALEIIDTYQADNARSIHTLSGGEKFLVSLALALGLSDLAGRDAKIQSLFIDEGFGTLDDNSLDLALSTLENLQSSGKTIGLISHVKELKERIGTQIKVVKQSTGFSRVEVVR